MDRKGDITIPIVEEIQVNYGTNRVAPAREKPINPFDWNRQETLEWLQEYLDEEEIASARKQEWNGKTLALIVSDPQ